MTLRCCLAACPPLVRRLADPWLIRDPAARPHSVGKLARPKLHFSISISIFFSPCQSSPFNTHARFS